jgi:hypothetical protein
MGFGERRPQQQYLVGVGVAVEQRLVPGVQDGQVEQQPLQC